MTAYVIYHKETTRYLCRHAGTKNKKEIYQSLGAAKSAITREAKLGAINADDFAVAGYHEFSKNIEKEEERHNIMNGKAFMTRVNSPHSSCPSSETYWCT